MSIKIAYVGDSVPITSNGKNVIEMLSENKFDVDNFCSSGITIIEIYDLLNNKDLSNYTHIILHFGIVDSSPRVLKKSEKKFIQKIKPNLLNKLIHKIIKENRKKILAKRKLITYTKLDKFEKFLKLIFAKIRSKKIIIVNICQITDDVNTDINLHRKQIFKYNDIIKKVSMNKRNVIYVDIYKEFSNLKQRNSYYTDGLHFSEKGHLKLKNTLENLIQ